MGCLRLQYCLNLLNCTSAAFSALSKVINETRIAHMLHAEFGFRHTMLTAELFNAGEEFGVHDWFFHNGIIGHALGIGNSENPNYVLAIRRSPI